MNLRTRVMFAVAATVAAAIVCGLTAAQITTRNQLRTETDHFLLERAASSVGQEPFGAHHSDDRPGGHETPVVEFDAVSQYIDEDGTVVGSIAGQPALPIDTHDLGLAKNPGTSRLRDVTVDGTHYRVVTASRPGGGAVQVARDMSEADAVLDALRNRVLLIGLVGTILAAGVAWLLARRIVRPVEQLTQASEYVASTQDLAARIPVDRDDEVGRLAASFNTMLVALETSREQQKRLVADAGHELRTPLTAVRTNIDLLQRAHNMDTDQRRELLAETQLELRELTDLMTELVDLASDVRREEPVVKVELGALVASVVERYRRRTGRSISLEVRAEAVVDARPGMLERAISNLVDNACKFSPAGDAVEVVVDGGCIEVLDRGLGVPRAERERVFDRFYRSDGARTMPGSGLGLAIVRQVVELHDGEVTLDERPGGGTVARLRLRASEVLPSTLTG